MYGKYRALNIDFCHGPFSLSTLAQIEKRRGSRFVAVQYINYYYSTPAVCGWAQLFRKNELEKAWKYFPFIPSRVSPDRPCHMIPRGLWWLHLAIIMPYSFERVGRLGVRREYFPLTIDSPLNFA